MVFAKHNGSDSLQASAFTEREAIGTILSMSTGDCDIWLFRNLNDVEPYKIVKIRA